MTMRATINLSTLGVLLAVLVAGCSTDPSSEELRQQGYVDCSHWSTGLEQAPADWSAKCIDGRRLTEFQSYMN